MALSLAAACEDGDGALDPSRRSVWISEVVVSPALDTLVVTGPLQTVDETQFQATLIGFSGGAISGPTVRWSAANPSIVSVDSLTGVARPRGVGRTTIVARAGGKTGTATVVIVSAPSRTPASLR
jgi:hypothetical protein